MTENKMALLMLKKTLEGLEQEQQDSINEMADKFRAIMDGAKESESEGAETMSQLAISLVGLETAVALGQ